MPRLSSKMSAATSSLTVQAGELVQAVAVFQLGQSDGPVAKMASLPRAQRHHRAEQRPTSAARPARSAALAAPQASRANGAHASASKDEWASF